VRDGATGSSRSQAGLRDWSLACVTLGGGTIRVHAGEKQSRRSQHVSMRTVVIHMYVSRYSPLRFASSWCRVFAGGLAHFQLLWEVPRRPTGAAAHPAPCRPVRACACSALSAHHVSCPGAPSPVVSPAPSHSWPAIALIRRHRGEAGGREASLSEGHAACRWARRNQRLQQAIPDASKRFKCHKEQNESARTMQRVRA
jgi:hypothetical protein